MDFLDEIRKMQALEKQIEKERIEETEKVNKMTDEERVEYLIEKEKRTAEFAKKIGMNQKQVVIDDNKES